MSNYRQKAPFNDWWYWSDVLSKRLRAASEIYREFDEVERSNEMAGIAKKLYDLFIGPARKGQKKDKSTEEKEELMKEEEAAIFEAVAVWRDVLTNLPFISQSMQDFMCLKWQEIDPRPPKERKKDKEKKDGEEGSGDAAGGASSGGSGDGGGDDGFVPKKADPKAIELLWGPKGRYDEGIRSGLPSDGGLPGILMNYLQMEKSSSNRSPTQYKTEAAHQQFWGRNPGMSGKM